MRCILFSVLFACFLALACSETLTLTSSVSDLTYFPFSTPTYARFGVYMQPCSQTDCCGAGNTCSASTPLGAACAGHAYCGTDSSNNCVSNTDETATVSILLGLEFACCWGDINQCGDTGGQVGGFITTGFTDVSFTLPYGKCYNYPTTDATSSAAWQFLGTQDLNTLIKPLCGTATGWTLALSRGYGRAINSAAIANVGWQGNNQVDALYFYGHFGVVQSTATVVPPTLNTAAAAWAGPTLGVLGGLVCLPDSSNVPPPPVDASTADCSTTCGCYFIDLLNRTDIGTAESPATLFTFKVCILCKYGFSYLQICGGALPLEIGGGSLCSYTETTLTGTDCIRYKWELPTGCTQPYLNGNCDIFTVTVYGIATDYQFNFQGHAGRKQTLDYVTIDTAKCTCGSACSTPAPTTPGPTTSVAATTTASTETTQPGETTTTPVGFSTTPASTETTPAGTTSSGTTPQTTTGNQCPDQYSAGPNCDCIYTGDPNAGKQAWCVPDGAGGYAWHLASKSEVTPTAPAGWFRPGTADSQGFQLDCKCEKKVINCLAECTGSTCICDTATGTCIANAVCNVVIETPPAGETCAQCPVGSNGAVCSDHGVCSCGVCVCASTATANYTGVDCSEVTGCDQFEDCTTCRTSGLKYNCAWCLTSTGGRCLDNDACANVGQELDCTGTVVFNTNPCPDNCSNNGICSTSDNITQCRCKKGYHGANCASSGGLSAAAKAAAISGGVIAAIVICGVIVLVIVAFGAKKGVDWIQLQNMANAKSHANPMYADKGINAESGLYVGK